MKISMVIPIYNESAGLEELFVELKKVLAKTKLDYEIICVNDGSSDNSLELLLQHRNSDEHIKLINFSRNFGKEIALTAGIDFATGDAVIPMDSDLQDPPDLILELIEKWREGFEVVLARRIDRSSDTKVKRNTATWFYKIFNKISEHPIPENVGDFRLLDKKIVVAIKKLRERNRFMKGILNWVGGKTAIVEYVRVKRSEGKSKLGYKKLFALAVNGITSFSSWPLKVWGYSGLVISGLAFVYACIIIVKTLILGRDMPGYASLMVCVLFLGGAQLLSLGVLGEYLGRIYTEVKQRPLYVVSATYGFDETQSDRS